MNKYSQAKIGPTELNNFTDNDSIKGLMKMIDLFRKLALFTFPFLLLSLHAQPLVLDVSAESAILINADTGAILYEKKPHLKLYPASITKIATAAYALKLKSEGLEEPIAATQDCIGSVTEEAKQRSGYTLPSHWLVTDCSHIGIKKGEILTLRDLFFGMMVASADDASNIIAERLGNGSIPSFMEGLNAYVQELGCKDTYFNNPHGLHHPKHVTTAYDMALITQEALKNAFFREVVATTRYTRPKTNKQDSTVLVQTNRLLRSGEHYYPRAIGVKTGWMSKSGSTFVAAAKDQDRTLIAVLMNVKERKDIFRDAIRLFDAAFKQVKVENNFIKAGPQRHSLEVEGADKLVKTYTADNVVLSYYPAEALKVKAYLQWDKLELPIKKGHKVGELFLRSSDGKQLASAPLYAQDDVNMKFSYRVKQLFKGQGSKIFLIVGGVIFLLGMFSYIKGRSR